MVPLEAARWRTIFGRVMILLVALAPACGGAQNRGTVKMLPNSLRDHFGPVASQLFEYEYQASAEPQRTPGQGKALVSARGWIESVLSERFQPSSEPAVFTHAADSGTCDAVQHRYTVSTGSGDFNIYVSQTVFLVGIAVAPVAAPANTDLAAIARSLFQQPDRLNLITGKQTAEGAMGHQGAAARPGAKDWIDSIRWWTDGRMALFTLLKLTGANAGAKASDSLEANRFWFQMFERPRAR